MIKHVFGLLVYEPLYNGLIFLMGVLPWADAGVSVIIFTFLVKLALFPISLKAVRSQLQMKAIQEDIDALKEKHKNDKQAHAQAMMTLYREKGINPFGSVFLALVQIPIILCLYYIFYSGGLPVVRVDLLYPFVSVPLVNMHFLGLIDISKKGILILSVLVAVSQYFQVRFAMPVLPKSSSDGTSFKNDFARTLNLQMRYILPVFLGFASYYIAGAVSLYWITSNLFAIGQELYVRRVSRV